MKIMKTEFESTNQWQQASIFFKKHFSSESTKIVLFDDYKALSEPVKLKVIKLFNNKELKHTILEQPGKHLMPGDINQDLSGQQIDSYKLIELIAHGGMSSVYRARKIDIKNQKDVAIKLIPTNLQTDEITSLFKRELETLSKLHHPNIISMHHGSVSQSGTPYLVMELVENALQIDQYFKQQNASEKVIIEYFITLCNVIEYAHQNNIIHQDIKPSNVLMDEHGHLLVLDFGVAALTEVIPEHNAYTLNYASPEQTIKNQFPHPTFDTYAIISLLIKCLGQFSDHQPGWQSKTINLLEIDQDLKTILEYGIAEQESLRYQQAKDLALDLSLWAKQMPISHLKNKPLYRLKKAVARHPSITAMAVFILISMTLGLVFYQQQYQIALNESIKAQQIKNILIEAIDQNDPDISKGNNLTVRDMLVNVELRHAENPATNPQTAIDLFLTLAQAFRKLGEYQSTEKNLQKILAIEPANIEALLELAELKVLQNNFGKAHQISVQLNQFNSSFTAEEKIRHHILRANSAIINSDFDLANELFNSAQLLADEFNQIDIKIKTMAHHADGLLEQDDMDLAIKKMTEAVFLSEQSLGSEHSQTLELKARLAETYLSFSGEKVEQAIELIKQIIPQQKLLLGENHPVVAKSLFLNATGLRALNKIPEARNNAEQALAIAEQQFGDHHLFTGKILMSLGAIYLQEKNMAKAIDYASKAVENHESLLGTEHPETLQYKTSYVAMLVENKQHAEALQLLLQIHPIQTAALGAEHRGTLYVDIVLSKTYVALGELEAGVLAGERCLQNARKSAIKNIMEVFCAITLENAYFLNQQYDQSMLLIEQYQSDPLVISRPSSSKQFKNHKTYIKEM